MGSKLLIICIIFIGTNIMIHCCIINDVFWMYVNDIIFPFEFLEHMTIKTIVTHLLLVFLLQPAYTSDPDSEYQTLVFEENLSVYFHFHQTKDTVRTWTMISSNYLNLIANLVLKQESLFSQICMKHIIVSTLPRSRKKFQTSWTNP